MKKRMILMIAFLLLVFGSIFGWDLFRGIMMSRYFASFKAPSVVVSTSVAKKEAWQPSLSAVGTFSAVNGVDISAEASGVIDKIYFSSGNDVNQGDLLVKIDDSVEQADLKNNVAALKLAQLHYKRTSDLYSKKVASKSLLDTAQAQLKQAQAVVDRTKALIAQKNIVAPFSGKVGILQANVGQYISPGAKIVTLQSLSSLFVNFYIPEQDVQKLYVNQPVKVKIDAYPNESFDGKVSAINAKADISTHNILVQASLQNDDGKLYPGLFANIKVLLKKQTNVIVIPETAVSYSLFGDVVFVVKEEGKDKNGKAIFKAQQKYVTTGAKRKGKVSIVKGINPGDTVISSGQLNLKDNASITINNSVKL